MASRTCWVCKVNTHMTLVGEAHTGGDFGYLTYGRERVSALFLCDNCRAPSIGIARNQNRHVNLTRWLAGQFDDAVRPDVTWFPEHAEGRSFPDVPDHIAAVASEAYMCLSIGAHRGVVTLARAVVEATAKAKGITKGNLRDKIDALEKQGDIRPLIKDAAHEVRFLGNDVAHGDVMDPVNSVEAEEVLGLVAEVLQEVFQSPAMLERRRAAREEQAAQE